MSRQKYRRKHKRPSGFDSPLEEMVWNKLPQDRTLYEPEKLPYVIEHYYKPDFVIMKKNGKKLYLEVKGYMRIEDQKKMRAVKECNPDLDIRFYFAEDRLVHRSKMKNSEWCAKYGFPCAIGKIPKRWLS
jgi:predicted nuclease of restriction endonuclease-like RecB superfamily